MIMILIPISGRPDIGNQNSDIPSPISAINGNIGYCQIQYLGSRRYRGMQTPISAQPGVQYRVQYWGSRSRYQGMLTPISGTISGTISGVPILGYGTSSNSDIGYYNYNIRYNIGCPDIGIAISDTISGVPTKHLWRHAPSITHFCPVKKADRK